MLSTIEARNKGKTSSIVDTQLRALQHVSSLGTI